VFFSHSESALPVMYYCGTKEFQVSLQGFGQESKDPMHFLGITEAHQARQE
jgi:hypothetical protein